jgi:hypothetical protein
MPTKLKRVVRLALYAFSSLLIVAMYAGVMSNARPGVMTWGPTTDFYASAIAISHIEYGLGGGLGYLTIVNELASHLTTTGSDIHVGDTGTRDLLARPGKVEEAFQAAARMPRSAMRGGPIEDGAYVTTWAEDIGYADFYEIAFRLFGYHALSTYWLFFSILTLSYVLFAAAYRDDDVATAALAITVAAAFLTGTADIFSDLVPSPAANRYLVLLTVLPCLHLLAAGLTKLPLTGLRLILVTGQAILYALTIGFRTSAIWTVIAAVTLLVAFESIKALQARKALSPEAAQSRKQFAAAILKSRPILLAGVIVFAGIGLPNLRNTQLHPVYFNEALPHHLRWHSAILGLSLHPLWPQKKPSPDLPDVLSDAISFKMFHNYMQQNRPGEPMTSSKVRNFYIAHLYEATMKDRLFEFGRANPQYMVELYGYYKPRLILSELAVNLRTVPWAAWLLSLPTLLLAFVLLTGVGVNLIAMIATAFVVWMSSQLPAIWAYPTSIVVADRLWATFVLIACLVLAFLVRANRIAETLGLRTRPGRLSP